MNTGKVLLAVATLLLASITSVSATVVYDNGPAGGDSSFCFTENGTSACGGGGNWIIYNAFTLPTTTTITGFTYNAYWESGSPSDYTGTVWSIWSGNPELAASPLYAGTNTGSLSSGLASSELVSVNGLDATLSPGLYWLGIGNDVDSANDVTTMASSSAAIAYGALSSNGTGVWDAPPPMAFTVEQDLQAPEIDSQMATTGLTFLGGVIAVLRGRKKATS